MWEYCKAHLCKQPTTTSLWVFSHPCNFVSFSFQPSLSWVGPYNWNVVYREQDMFLLHLIASCLDDQILGLPRPLKGPMGLFSPGIAMEHLGSTIRRPNPLGKKYALKNLGQQPANERWMGHFWHRKPLEMTMAYQHGQRKWTTTTFLALLDLLGRKSSWFRHTSLH